MASLPAGLLSRTCFLPSVRAVDSAGPNLQVEAVLFSSGVRTPKLVRMTIPADILSYQESLDEMARPICDRLLGLIETALPDAERKVWHAHPVWFFEGNPVVGFDRLKQSVRLLFWSGQSFATPGLQPEGSFKAAEIRLTDAAQIDDERVAKWLNESREIQWNYRDIRRNRGLEPLRGLG